MGFEELRSALVANGEPLEENEVKFSDEQLADLAALKIVQRDADIAEQFINTKKLAAEWNRSDDLFRAFVVAQNWPNTDKARANLSMPVIMEAIETLLPQIFMGFFSDKQPFLLEPKGRTTPAAARAMSKLLTWSFALKEVNFKEEIRKALKADLLYGMCVLKWGWQTITVKKKKFKRVKGKITPAHTDQYMQVPTLEWVDLRNILVHPGTKCHDIRTAKSVIHQIFKTADELDAMRDDPTYKNIPTRAEMISALTVKSEAVTDSLDPVKQETFRVNQAEREVNEQNADPLKDPLEILEWTDGNRVIAVLQRKIVIRNDENEFGEINYNSCSFIDVLNAWIGFGCAKLLHGEQALQTGVANAYIDALNLFLNPVWHRKKGIKPNVENIVYGPGKVINDDGEMEPLQTQMPSIEAFQAIQASDARARRRVGANGGPDMPTQAMRTSEGVQQFTAGLEVKLQYFIEQFATMVFIPIVEKFIELMKDNLTEEQVKEILSDEEAEAFEGDVIDIYNGRYAVDVLTSTKLAAKKAAMAMVPMLAQFFSSQPVQGALAVQGKKLDFAEFASEIFEMAGYDVDELIVDMTPEDQQRQLMSNPAYVKAQGDMAQTAQEHQNDKDLLDQKGDVQAGVAVVKSILKKGEEPPAAIALQPQGVPSGA